ncbi:MAG: T9SS type A sorting domain-containing protein [bacterium]
MKIICAKALIHIYSFLLLTSYFSLIYAQAPDTLWTKIYGGVEHDCGYSVQQTTDKGYIVTGYTGSFGAGGGDVYLIMTDSLGDTLWTKTYGGVDSEGGFSVQQTTDKGYIITGRTESFGAGSYDVYIIKTDSLGDTLWTKTCGGIEDDEGRSVKQTTDGGYIIAGHTWSFGAGYWDVYLIRLGPDTLGIEETARRSMLSALRLQVYPNPFRQKIQIRYMMQDTECRIQNFSLKIYDVDGKLIKILVNQQQEAGYYVETWDGRDKNNKKVSNGIYFLRFEATDYSETRKLLLIR